MTDEELRTHWGESPPTPARTGPLPLRVWALLMFSAVVLGLLAILIIPSISGENERARQREIRVCEMAKVLAGEDPAVAELLCAESWKR